MSHISEQILALLEDDSFPSMVRLDGEWGTGKTHYIKHELLPTLEEKGKKVIFFSLIGLSSIDDFRDKLISCVYLSEKVDQGLIGKLKDGGFAILNNVGEHGGTITSILKGSTGAVKHAMLNRISNVTVILDDLERVANSKLEKDIVGECLQLIDEKNLEFIFVMNGKETSIDKAMLEKSFSDRVYFSRSSHEILEIAFANHDYFRKYQYFIEQKIHALEFTNLRAMKRAANRLNNIYDLIIKDDNLDVDASMELIIEDVLRISYLHYCMEKTSDEIIKGLDYSANLKLRISNEDEEYDEFKNYRTISTPTDEMVEYCCGKIHLPPIIDNLGRLPWKASPIDKLMFSRCYMLPEEEFHELLKILTDFIFVDVDVPISRWFESCDFYLYLLDKGFVEGDRV
ncbi:P-loop NTPase fold protein, partial [Photobacterium damselae]|uniref:P-loop NTPase fold protein n=1 Tax=Photobacterium damselae TaxID=38293 RepID=UPI002F401AA5